MTAAAGMAARMVRPQRDLSPDSPPTICAAPYPPASTMPASNPTSWRKLLNHRMQGVMAVYNRAEYAEQRIKAYEKLERIVLGVVS